ncbi:MAG: MFS transporter [Chloroflexota bacterium]|nr:MAG: MFS transporter [Chloroflexota bacterium]
MSQSPDDGGQPGWQRTFAVLWLSQAIAMIGFAAVLPFMPLYVRVLGVTDPSQAAVWAGAIASIAALTQAVMAPVWGTWADRYGRKPMVSRSILSGGVVVAAMAAIDDVRQLLVARAVQGIFAGTLSATRVLVAAIVPPSKLGQSMGLMATSAFVGASFGPVLGGFVADTYGFRASFLVTGGLLFLSGVSVVFFVHERFERPPTRERPTWRANLAVMRDFPRVRAVVISIFVAQTGQTAIAPVLPLFIVQLIDSETAAASIAGTILGAAAVSGAAAAAIGGRLGDRVGHRRVLAFAALASGILYLPQALVQSPWELLVLRAITGAFAGAIMPVSMAMIGLLAPPDRRGWVFGLTASAMALGNATGPLIGSAAAAVFGFRASFLVTACALSAAGAWIAWSLRGSSSSEKTTA